jgi:hypothetical protein
MRLSTFFAIAILSTTTSLAQAQSSPDPLYGNDPHAKAVLDCHADYAKRYAKAITSVKATPTEVATAAYAYCAGQFNAFAEAVAAAAKTSDNPKSFTDPGKYQAEQVAKLRDYSFAYTLDAYLQATTAF